MRRLVVFLVAVLFVVSIIGCGGSQETATMPTTQVQVDSGILVGKVLDSGVKSWLGVPFAKPPVRELRWKEPQPNTWQGVYNADRKMPGCIQLLRPRNINHYFGEDPTSEDCLYMNIWAPPDSTANSKLPVIVFIYGGGLTVGSSGMAAYDGDQVAQRGGAVYVDFNYRVGFLGFMAHPELTQEQGGHSGNYGFLDQNAALKWVNRNIDKFGGDPSKVIITGQSGGARSVAEQVFSPLSKGLFRGAMMMSGCNWTTEYLPLAEAEKKGLELQKALKANNLDDMRQIPPDRLLASQDDSRWGWTIAGVKTPGLYIDGYFMPKTKAAILEAHEINDVPIIASLTHDENDIAMKQAKTVAEYEALAKVAFGGAAQEFLKLYPVSGDAEIMRVANDAATDATRMSASCNCASLQAKYNKSPAFITMWSRVHPYVPGVKFADHDTATVGAYHMGEIPYYFGTFDVYNLFHPTRNWTSSDRELSQKMMASLIAFANTGNPSTADVNWPIWSAENEQYVDFGDEITLGKVNRARLDFMAKNPPKPGPPAPAPRGGS